MVNWNLLVQIDGSIWMDGSISHGKDAVQTHTNHEMHYALSDVVLQKEAHVLFSVVMATYGYLFYVGIN